MPWEGGTFIQPPTPAPGGMTADQHARRIERENAVPLTPEEQAELAARHARMRAASAKARARINAARTSGIDGRDVADIGDDPPDDPYDYASPLANRMPAASGITSDALVGMPAVWITEREHLLASVPVSAAPFQVGVVYPGMNYPLSQQDVDALNAHYFGEP